MGREGEGIPASWKEATEAVRCLIRGLDQFEVTDEDVGGEDDIDVEEEDEEE